MNVAVVIVTYNAEKYLQNCLQSLLQSEVPVKIYIVDNHSTDATTGIINRYLESCNNLVLLQNSKNIGFGAANNIGLRKAYDEGFEFFFLINQDVYIQPNTVYILLQQLASNRSVGIISPLHKNGAGNSFDKNFARYMSNTAEIDFVNDLYFSKLKTLYFVPFINAACWLLPRKTLETVGGFDPLFFHYGEDENYCNRVLFHQLKIAVATATFVRHDRDDRNGKLRMEFDKEKNERIWLLKMSDVFHERDRAQHKILYSELMKVSLFHIATLKFLRLGKAIRTLRLKHKKLAQISLHKRANKIGGMHWL